MHNERDVLRYAVVLGGFFLVLSIAIAAFDPTANLAAIDAEHVQATLTCVATFAFGVLSWGLLHLRAMREGPEGARARAWRNRTEED